MSATRDQNQKVTFVYSNLYTIYQKGKTAAHSAVIPAADVVESSEAAPLAVKASLSKSQILKMDDLHKPEVQVSTYNPAAFIGKRVARPASLAKSLPPAQQPTAAVNSLKENLKSLNDLHSRLRFMLQELEELVKK